MPSENDLPPGEFGTASGLSPKALRLYAEQGLLRPARLDEVTGYRRYDRDQVPVGRLIARLRRLDLPLARIAVLVTLRPAQRRAELRAWLREREERLRLHRALVDALEADPDPAAGSPTGSPVLRARPERLLLCREGRAVVGELDTFVDRALGCIRAHLRARGLPDDGPALVTFHGFVTHDSDGPVEVAVPAAGPVDPVADLRVRLSPAGTDAVLPVSGDDAGFPGILLAYTTLESWIDANRLVCAGSPVEVRPGADGALLDVTYPVVRVVPATPVAPTPAGRS